ncbi:MAG: hypothetical protein KF681_10960 [Bdellovibrionaceae bacterium]|nr:hypothetical protein [Pseudobdellovibrionaceae bacterium]
MTDLPEHEVGKEQVKRELDAALSGGSGPKLARFALAVLSGAVPYAGGLIGAAGGAWSEKENERFQRILKAWLKLQEDEIKEIGQTLVEVMARLDQQDEKVQLRIESAEYMKILKKCFRDWSAAESEEKRILIRNLLVNAASPGITPDDIIRLFIEWIGRYSELHFKVIRAVYNHDGITRAEIWEQIHGNNVSENSAEADLFKIIIHDLSVGHIIRQHREVDYNGNFVRQPPKRAPKGSGRSSTYTSAFDGEKQYELTGLGQQFVHYTMDEVITKIAGGKASL